MLPEIEVENFTKVLEGYGPEKTKMMIETHKFTDGYALFAMSWVSKIEEAAAVSRAARDAEEIKIQRSASEAAKRAADAAEIAAAEAVRASSAAERMATASELQLPISARQAVAAERAAREAERANRKATIALAIAIATMAASAIGIYVVHRDTIRPETPHEAVPLKL